MSAPRAYPGQGRVMGCGPPACGARVEGTDARRPEGPTGVFVTRSALIQGFLGPGLLVGIAEAWSVAPVLLPEWPAAGGKPRSSDDVRRGTSRCGRERPRRRPSVDSSRTRPATCSNVTSTTSPLQPRPTITLAAARLYRPAVDRDGYLARVPRPSLRPRRSVHAHRRRERDVRTSTSAASPGDSSRDPCGSCPRRLNRSGLSGGSDP
jgi:hypothetical protein